MQTGQYRTFDYDAPLSNQPTSACHIRQAWACVPEPLPHEATGRLKNEIGNLLERHDAVLVAHYYVDPLIQDLAFETGGCVGDSLEMARFGAEHPEAVVLVHPESPAGVTGLGDVGGSTSKLLKAAIKRPEQTFIVATDLGILHEMRKHAPHKTFIAAPTAGNGATCKSCAFYPWMAMNSLQGIRNALENKTGEILLDEQLGKAAKLPLDRMLNFAAP